MAPCRLGGEKNLVVAVGDDDLDVLPPPALLVEAEIDGDDDDAEELFVLHHPPGVVEAVAAVVVLGDREDRRRIGFGEGVVGLVALVLLARAVVAGGDDAAFGVEQEDRAGAEFVLEGGEAFLGAGVGAGLEREDQDRVAGEEQRHHGMALDRALDRSGVEGGAHGGVGVLVLGEGAGQVGVARPDDQRRRDHRRGEADTRPYIALLRHGRRTRARRCSCLAHGHKNKPARPGTQAPCKAPWAIAAARPAKSRAPSVPPCTGSAARSGWGIRPRTRRLAERMPAMSAVEPLGLSA